MKDSFGYECELPNIGSASHCVNWWFSNSSSTRAVNVMNCKDIDGCLDGVEWTMDQVVIDCGLKDFVAKYIQEFQKAKEAGGRTQLVIKTQLTEFETGALFSYFDDNHPAPNIVRSVLFVNDLSSWSPASVSRIPSFIEK